MGCLTDVSGRFGGFRVLGTIPQCFEEKYRV